MRSSSFVLVPFCALLFAALPACPLDGDGGEGEGEGEGEEGEGEEGEGEEGEGEGEGEEGEGEGEEGEGEGEGEGCRSQADCDGTTSCVSANDGPSCGIPPPLDDCAVDDDCPEPAGGSVCQLVDFGTCAQHLACAVNCNDVAGQQCAADEECAVDGHCEPILCTAGFVCESWQLCAPPEGGDAVDRHSCVTPECASDDGCDSAGGEACVNGLCAPSPGQCLPPVP